MDYYNNYYEELYHAGLFSALRGRIRDGHKWLTRTGTPGHYVYTYAKDLAGKASGLFTRRRATVPAMATRQTTRASRTTKEKREDRGAQPEKLSSRTMAEREKRQDRFLDRTGMGLVTRQFNGKGVSDPITNYISRYNRNAADRIYDESKSRVGRAEKSTADRIKEWGANTLSSIRKTANDAAGAVSKGYESAKNWVSDLVKRNSGGYSMSPARKASGSVSKTQSQNGSVTLNQKGSKGSVTVQQGWNGSKPKGWDEYYNQKNGSSSSSTSSSSRPRRREKNVTNTVETAVAPKTGNGLGIGDHRDKRRANPDRVDENNVLVASHSPRQSLDWSTTNSNFELNRRRKKSRQSRSR